jgi:CRP-like cAMP-binding protein
MSQHAEPLAAFVRKLESHSDLSAEESAAIYALPCHVRAIGAHRQIVNAGSSVTTCGFLVSGYAARTKIVGTGARQIMALHVRGDGLDLHNMLLPWADHDIVAITNAEVAFVPADALRQLVVSSPGAARAVWRDTLLSAAIEREWVVNVGRRDALTRVSHLLCEFVLRQHAAGIGGSGRYELPLTQEAIGDCTGLTSVHVNRTMQRLRGDSLISTQGNRELYVVDWEALTRAADFQPEYLYADGVGRNGRHRPVQLQGAGVVADMRTSRPAPLQQSWQGISAETPSRASQARPRLDA